MHSPVELVEEFGGEDNRRFSVALGDASRVEAVVYRSDSLCVSSQVGCAVRCPFCASGAHGLDRNLELGEMVGQVERVRERCPDVRRVTVSGVGEPLHNHRNVMSLADWCRGEGLGFSLTTSGGPLARLREWLRYPHRGITISVHAGTEEARALAVPKAPPLAELFEVLQEELAVMSQSKRKKLALAYLLIEGLNDADSEIDAFMARVRDLDLKLHLYSYNAVPTSSLAGVSRERYEAIASRLRAAGLQVRMSAKARTARNGGCGTLVAQHRLRRGRVARLPVANGT